MSRVEFTLLIVAAVVACSEDGGGPAANSETLSYYANTKSIIDARCATCHQPGDIGPFSLTTYDEVRSFQVPVRSAIENGTMPPWQPSDACNSYLGNIDLTADEKEILLAWLAADMPAGDPADAPEQKNDGIAAFEADLSLQLPQPYTPTREPDDYRCQLIPWPATETQYVTGLRVTPDQRSIVHHVIVFLAEPDEVAQFQAFDEAEDGPGYTCYGGPTASTGGGFSDIDPAALLAALQRVGVTLADLQAGNLTDEQFLALADELGGGAMAGGFRTIGSWTPGIPAAALPSGTGIRVEPGSMLVAQFHYNTLTSAPVPDQSIIEIATTDTVEREATGLGILDIGWVTNGLFGGDPMTIPAGEANVQHATSVAFDSLFFDRVRDTLGLPADAPLVLHNANHHMHELGKSQRSEIRHVDGSTSCVLDIPDWDFQWQGTYTLARPITIRPGDEIWMGCTWDNTAANQPIIDGQARAPVDVAWGEGTSDEMCLGSFYVTGQ